MEASFYFYTILAALGYIFLESLFMVGVWISAKGETEKMPNGKDYDSEMILFPFKKMVMKSRQEIVVFEGVYFKALIVKTTSADPIKILYLCINERFFGCLIWTKIG